MKIVIGFAVLVLFQWLGETLKSWFDLPLPGPVIGMILLLMALMVYGKIPSSLQQAAQPFLQHMSLLFILPGVGLFFLPAHLYDAWLSIALALIIGTAVTLSIVSLLMQRLFSKS